MKPGFYKMLGEKTGWRKVTDVVTFGAFAAVLFCFVCPACLADEKLDSARKIYVNNLKKIESDYSSKNSDVCKDYNKTLTGLMKTMRDASDLEGWAAVKAELDRFGDRGNIPSDALVEKPAELHSAQNKYRMQLMDLSLDRDKKIVTLNRKYLDHLDKMLNAYLAEKKMQNALLVKQEIEQVNAGEVTVETGEDPESSGEDTAGDDGPVLSEELKIYADGNQPAPIKGVDFRMRTLRPTEFGRRIRKVVCTLETDKESDIETSTENYSYSSSTTRRGSTDHHVRLTLKPVNIREKVSDPLLVVQYYGRDIGAEKGKIDPFQLTVQHVPLNKIDGKGVCVDLPPVSTEKYSKQYKSSCGYSSSYKHGRKLYGIVVSVFDSQKKLIYQSTTEDMLGKMATDKVPEESREQKLARLRCKMESVRQSYMDAQRQLCSSPHDESLRKKLDEAREEYHKISEEMRSLSYGGHCQ